MGWDCLCILLSLSKGVREGSESYKAGMGRAGSVFFDIQKTLLSLKTVALACCQSGCAERGFMK